MNVFAPGETITVRWNEYIDHPSYYRIAFDDDGDDGFEMRDDAQTNAQADNPEQMEAALGMDADILAIVREVNDTTQGDEFREARVTLPNINCENCTLQLIQYMYDNPPPSGGYYQCADIALRGALQVSGADAGSGGSANAGEAGSAGQSGAAGAAGSAGSGPAASGGTSSNGGTSAAPGTSGAGGRASANGGSSSSPAGSGGASGSGAGVASPGDGDDGGCSLGSLRGGSAAPSLFGLLALSFGLVRRPAAAWRRAGRSRS